VQIVGDEVAHKLLKKGIDTSQIEIALAGRLYVHKWQDDFQHSLTVGNI
jgi:SOS response regulatory protein OraA/RecX